MSGVLRESAFEASIEAHLLANGWTKGSPASYDRALGLDPNELVAFLKASQPEEWEQLCLRLGSEAKAAAKVAERVAKEIDARGTVDVLRRETKLNGVGFRVAFFAPANDLTPELRARYEANRLTVVRQLHHSESKPRRLAGPGADGERDPDGDGGVEERAVGADGRGRDGAVPDGPEPERSDLQAPGGGELRGRPRSGVHDHPAGGAGRPGSCRSTRAPTAPASRGCREPAEPGRVPHARTCGSGCGRGMRG